MAASAATLSFCTDDPRIADVAGNPEHGSLVRGKAPSRYCGTGCGVEVSVTDGNVMAVRGDQLAEVNKGLLCVKGYHLPAMLYGQDRLKFPMILKADDKADQAATSPGIDFHLSQFSELICERTSRHGERTITLPTDRCQLAGCHTQCGTPEVRNEKELIDDWDTDGPLEISTNRKPLGASGLK